MTFLRALAVVLAAFLGFGPGAVRAAVFPCTEMGILDAIAAGGGPHTFSCGGPTTVSTSAEIAISNSVILDGGGDLTVDAGSATYRVFSVPSGVTVELRDLTISGGNFLQVGVDSRGGGILNEGDLTLTDATVTDNVATNQANADGFGGGIFNTATGTLTLQGTTVSGNDAGNCTICTGNAAGGGILNLGTATITDSTISGNRALADTGATAEGGGLANGCGDPVCSGATPSLDLLSSTVTGNAAEGNNASGGGLTNRNDATVEDSTISDNETAAGFAGSGAGVFNGGTLEVDRSTISGNRPRFGVNGLAGGFFNAGSLTLTNSTVSDNDSSFFAGGIVLSGAATLVLRHTTLSNNGATFTGAHIGSDGGFGSATFENTLVDGNCNALTGGTITSNGGNLESPGNTCSLTDASDQVSVSNGDLALGPLADDGGPTETHALLPGSFALDAAVGCPPPSIDQRGVSRPQGPACDTGAFERGVPVPALPQAGLGVLAAGLALAARRALR